MSGHQASQEGGFLDSLQHDCQAQYAREFFFFFFFLREFTNGAYGRQCCRLQRRKRPRSLLNVEKMTWTPCWQSSRIRPPAWLSQRKAMVDCASPANQGIFIMYSCYSWLAACGRQCTHRAFLHGHLLLEERSCSFAGCKDTSAFLTRQSPQKHCLHSWQEKINTLMDMLRAELLQLCEPSTQVADTLRWHRMCLFSC